jgi:hypothetical protein
MSKDPRSILTFESNSERASRDQLSNLMENSPIPLNQRLSNLGLYLDAKNLSRILFMDFMYRQIVDVQGVVMDFGTRWGNNMVLFQSLRGIYEPFNRHRKILGFDTFTGFPSVDAKDGNSPLMYEGNLTVGSEYKFYLEELLAYHESLNPLAHISKVEVCVGDASLTLPKYIDENPETIIALAYFDFDIYEPTKICLEAIKPRLVKGSVLGFDELNDPDSPGETLALMEVFGLNNIQLKRFPYTSRTSYFVVE